MPEISFTTHGQAPSKGNHRNKRFDKKSRERWARIKDYEAQVGKAATALKAKRISRSYSDHHVTVEVHCYNQRADSDNIGKAVYDALEGICYQNDKYVKKRNENRKDKGKGRVEITVTWSKR